MGKLSKRQKEVMELLKKVGGSINRRETYNSKAVKNHYSASSDHRRFILKHTWSERFDIKGFHSTTLDSLVKKGLVTFSQEETTPMVKRKAPGVDCQKFLERAEAGREVEAKIIGFMSYEKVKTWTLKRAE